MRTRLSPDHRRLPEALSPSPFTIDLGPLALARVGAAERELALHSGVDGPHGHFAAAYGYDRQARTRWPGAGRP